MQNEWNDARSLRLMEMARQRREQPVADSLLRDYQAHAEGIVYFYLDRSDTDERVLVKTDQVALDVFWAQPNRTKQHIVGLRGENALPNRMYYHLDHLTVVQNGFGDVMRMGDGEEVADVPHPAAPGSDSIYDFRLADSLTLLLPGAPGPIKAIEIHVRPKRTDRSAIIGSVFVDHATGDLVRMAFTFTPVSYVDDRLERINISLDHSLWEGKYWLPHEQAVEIRRQIPELDFVATSVIQGRFRIAGYRFNQELAESLFWGYPVALLPRAQREAYPFDRGIYDDLHEAGLALPAQMAELRAQATALVRQRLLSGLPRFRLSLPDASSVLRYDRAQGLYLGAGVAYSLGATTRLESTFGWALGAAQPVTVVRLRRDFGDRTTARLDGFANEPRDLGIRPGAPRVFNTFSALGGDDYLDLYYASGVRIEARHGLAPAWHLAIGAAVERHESAVLSRSAAPLGGEFRPVRPVDQGTWTGASIALERTLAETAAWSWGGRLSLEAAALDGEPYAVERLDLSLRRGSARRHAELRNRITAGLITGGPPAQKYALIGGRNTIPGHAYRAFAGEAFVLADVEASRDLIRPWLGARALAAAGWTGDLRDLRENVEPDRPNGNTGPARVHELWNAPTTDHLRTAVGLGLAVGYDVIRIDVVRGLGRGGEWQLMFSVDPKLWGVL